MTSGRNCMELGRWVVLRVLLVTMELNLGNIFMIPHNYYFVQVTGCAPNKLKTHLGMKKM